MVKIIRLEGENSAIDVTMKNTQMRNTSINESLMRLVLRKHDEPSQVDTAPRDTLSEKEEGRLGKIHRRKNPVEYAGTPGRYKWRDRPLILLYLALLDLEFKEDIALLEDQKLPKGSEEFTATYNIYIKEKAAIKTVQTNYQRQKEEYSARSVRWAIDGTNRGAGPVGEMLVELLMDAYSRQNLQGSSRKGTEQSQFRADSIAQYNSKEPGGDGLWCPILDRFLPADQVRAAHIFPHGLGTKIMTMCFGQEAPNEIMSPRNCLMISSILEEKLDTHLLVIVPVTGSSPDQPTQ